MSDSSDDIIVRPAHIRDVKPLVVLIEPFVAQKILLPRTIDELALLLPNYFVAEFQGSIIGCAALEIYSSKLAELRSLVVHPDHQHRGVGHKLVAACLERAHEELVLEVMAITSAEAFFVSCGFDFTLPGQKKALFFQTRES